MPTEGSDEPILPLPNTNRDNQSSPNNTINNITCVSDNFQKQLNMLYPYQLQNRTSLVNGNLVLLERKYRALPHLELRERLIDMCLGGWYDETVRDLCGTSYEDWLRTKDTNLSQLASEELTTSADKNPSRSTSEDISYSRSDYEEISNSGSLLGLM